MPIAALRPLRHRDYALLWAASLVSNIGTWMETVAVGTLIAHDTGKASAVGLAAAAAFLPSALLSPIGGLISDRINRKRFLLASLAFDTTLAFVLAALIGTGHRSPALLSVVLFLEGCSGALALPNRQSLMPELVPREDLLGAVALGSMSWNGGRIVGPALAALLIETAGTTWAVVANAVSFAVMLGAACFIRLPGRSTAHAVETVRQRLMAGVNGVRHNADCRLGVLIIVTIGATAGPFIGLIPIVAHSVFKGNAGATGFLVTGQGVGAVLGALLAPSLAIRFGRERMIAGFMVVIPVALALYASAPTLWVAVLALVLLGGCYMSAFAGAQGLLQLGAAPHLKARVLAMFSVALGVSYTIGVSLNGVLADHIGIRQVHWFQCAASVVGTACLAFAVPRWWRRSSGTPTGDTDRRSLSR